MLLLVDKGDSILNNNDMYGKFTQLYSHTYYGIIDTKTGHVIDIKLGKYIIDELERDASRSKDYRYANVVMTSWHNSLGFRNIGVCSYRVNGCSRHSAIYQFINFDERDLHVIDSNFNAIVINFFRCGDETYLRVGTWIYKVDMDDLFGGRHISIGGMSLDMTGTGIQSSLYLYTVLGVDCIHYLAKNSLVYFNLSTKFYDVNVDVKDRFCTAVSFCRIKIDLKDGILTTKEGSYRGTDIDAFNKNLIFGGLV